MAGNKRNIALLLAVYCLQGMVFYSPIATLYRQAAGLDLAQIGFIESVSLGVMLALEIPWGIAADRIGHRRTIVICAALFALSKLIFWRAESFAGFLAERIVLGACLAGLSGCDAAFLFACCQGEEHRKIYARCEAVQTLGMLAAALVWPLLGGDYRLSALLTLLTYSAAALLTLLLREPEGPRAQQAQKAAPQTFRQAARHTLVLAPALLAVCLLRETAQTVTVFLGQLQFAAAGIPQSWFGALQAGVVGAGLLGGLSHRMLRRLGLRRAGEVLMGAGAAACLFPILFPGALTAAAGVLALRAVQSLLGPLSLSMQSEQAQPAGRATQLSCNAMLMDIAAMGVYPAFGALADRSLDAAFLLGGACCAAALVLFGFSRPISRAIVNFSKRIGAGL